MEIDYDIILSAEELEMVEVALEYYASTVSDEELGIIDSINQKIVNTKNGDPVNASCN